MDTGFFISEGRVQKKTVTVYEMIEIKVRLSENSSEEERSRLHIEDGAVRDFLGTGYIDCIYDAEVVHHFPPRAISPDQIQFFIELC